MKVLGKYWKLLLAVILIAVAAYLYFDGYKTEQAAYETETQQLNTIIAALQNNIAENAKYVDIQDDLEGAKAEIEASRLALYEHFPVEMKEEDQIMYVLYLETIFGTEINFTFSEPVSLVALRDGSNVQGLLMTVNYETTYEGFQEMISYLATDERITSVYEATIEYDADKDIAAGYVTLILYLVDTDSLEYTPPDVAQPEIGKENIFE